MKAFKYLNMAVVAVMMSIAVFSSCSSDNDDLAGDKNKTSEKVETSKESYSRLRLKYYFGQDFFKSFDVTISYTDVNGSQKTENISEANCEKKVLPQDSDGLYVYEQSVKYGTFPFDINYKLDVTPKAGVTEAQGRVGMGCSCSVNVVNGVVKDSDWMSIKYVKDAPSRNVNDFIKYQKERKAIHERKVTTYADYTLKVHEDSETK